MTPLPSPFKHLTSFIPAILWSLVILGLSTMPSISLPESFWDLLGTDKLGHALVYGIFTFLLLKACLQKNIQPSSAMTIAFFIATFYGILMEWIQFSFFPNRYFEILDIIANIIGSFGSLLVFRFFIK